METSKEPEQTRNPVTIVQRNVNKGFQRSREKVMEYFHAIFIINFLLDLTFAIIKLKDWVGKGGMESRSCYAQQGVLLQWIDDLLFFIQLSIQVAMLIHAPTNIAKFLGDDSPFAGDSRSDFYHIWWFYALVTCAVGFTALRNLVECGVVCDQYCVDHYVFAIGDWLCLVLNVALLIYTRTDGFRKTFTSYTWFDTNLGNPPSMDWSTMPNIRMYCVDGSGEPMTIEGTEFEAILVNDCQPFIFDTNDFHDCEQLTERQSVLTDDEQESTPILGQTERTNGLLQEEFILSEAEREELAEEEEEKHGEDFDPPFAVRVAVVYFQNNNLGILEVKKSDFITPPTLSIPDYTIMKIRPRRKEDRDRLIIKGSQDIFVVGTQYIRLERKVCDIFLSHVVRTNKILSEEAHRFFQARKFSVFQCENIAGGDNFRAIIAENSMYSKYFIIFMDIEWMKSGECKFESNMALRRNLTTASPVIIPVLIYSDQEKFFKALSFYPEIAGILDTYSYLTLDPNNHEKTFHDILAKIGDIPT